MKAVVVQTIANKANVERLVSHCRILDGTQITVIPMSGEYEKRYNPLYEDNLLACKRGFIFHCAALAMKEHFVFLRAGVLPQKRGWLKALEKEYVKVGKPILLSDIEPKPGDILSGIGIYPPEAHYLIPVDFKQGEWDGWARKHLKDIVGHSGLIAQVFSQSKAKPIKTGKIFMHGGDAGDLIAMLPTMKQLGGGILRVSNHPKAGNGYFRPIKGKKYEGLRPLLEIQPYIQKVEYLEEPKAVNYNFWDFRTVYQPTLSLAHQQAKYIGVKNLVTDAWLTCQPSPISKGKVVIGRSCRYHSRLFPWKKIVDKYGDKIIYIGFPEEHQDFEKYVGRKVNHIPTNNLLEAAMLIQGSELLISNQTSFTWIGIGLGKTLIQEVHNWNPDSMIERNNAQYIPGWEVNLPEL